MPNPIAQIIVQATRRGTAFKTLQDDLGNLVRRATVVGTAASAALAVIEKKAFANIDALAKTADAIGVTTEKLVGLQLAAQITGVESDQFNKALLRQQKTVYDAQQGLSAATDALDTLGLKVEDLLGMSADQQFVAIATAMEKVENATIRSGAAAQIYGARNVAVLKTLELGEEGLRRYADEAEHVGIAINRIDAAKIEAANDAMTLAKRSIEGVANVIAVELAPIVQGLATAFVDSTADAEVMGSRVHSVIDDIARGAGVVGDAFYGWRLIFKLVDAGVAELGASVVTTFEDINSSLADSLKIAAAFNAPLRPMVSALEAAANAGLGDSLREAAEQSERVYEALVNAEKPSEKIAEALAAAREEAQRTAEAAAQIASVKAANAGAGAPESDEAVRAREAAEKAAEQQRQQLAQQLEDVRQYTLTREQIEVEAIQRRLEILANAREQELIDQQKFQDLSIEVARKGQKELDQIASRAGEQHKENIKTMAGGAADALEALTGAFAGQSKKMFELHKKAAEAQAIVNTWRSVSEALAAYPPPVSFVMAAAAAAAGFQTVRNIQAQSFSGGAAGGASIGSGPSASMSTQSSLPSPAQSPTSDPQRAAPIINVNINAPIYGIDERETARHIAEQISHLINNNDMELMAPDSLNAYRIRAG